MARKASTIKWSEDDLRRIKYLRERYSYPSDADTVRAALAALEEHAREFDAFVDKKLRR